MKGLKKIIALLLCVIMVLSFVACGNKEENQVNTNYEFTETFENGSTEFVFGVLGVEGEEKYFEVKTDKTIVGEALLETGLIEGEDSAYGLYVKTVDGTTLDYDTDGKYWAFYVNGEYAATAVDQTEVVAGTLYEFKAE